MPTLRDTNRAAKEDPEFLGAFTNIPKRAGMPAEDQEGEFYQYRPDIPQKGPAEIEAERAKKREEDIVYDRDRFEEVWLKKIGGNPFLYNEEEELQKIQARKLPQLFHHVFPNMSWEDRKRMSKEDAAYWEKAMLKFNRYHRDQLKAKKQQLVDAYNWGMENFDQRAKQSETFRKEKMAREETARKERIATGKETAKEQSSDISRITALEKMKLDIRKKNKGDTLTMALLAGKGLADSPLAQFVDQPLDDALIKRMDAIIDREIAYRKQRSFPDEMEGGEEAPPTETMSLDDFKAKYGLGVK